MCIRDSTAAAASGCAYVTAAPGPPAATPTRRSGPAPRGRGPGAADHLRSAVLLAVDREPTEPVLQGSPDPLADAGPARRRAVHHQLPAARSGPHRLLRAADSAQARVAVRRPVPSRPGDDHVATAGRGLDHPPSP